MAEKVEVYFNHENYAQALAVYVFVNNPDGTRSICTDLKENTYKVHHPGMAINEPTFRLEGDKIKPFLQGMANELHRLGVKAEEAPVLENELSSTKYHLEDMRALVFENYKHEIIREVKK